MIIKMMQQKDNNKNYYNFVKICSITILKCVYIYIYI